MAFATEAPKDKTETLEAIADVIKVFPPLHARLHLHTHTHDNDELGRRKKQQNNQQITRSETLH